VEGRARRRSFVALLLWMTAKNGLDGRPMRLGEAGRSFTSEAKRRREAGAFALCRRGRPI
jgi:hypothetical protein